jgi:hypothetical protein
MNAILGMPSLVVKSRTQSQSLPNLEVTTSPTNPSISREFWPGRTRISDSKSHVHQKGVITERPRVAGSPFVHSDPQAHVEMVLNSTKQQAMLK